MMFTGQHESGDIAINGFSELCSFVEICGGDLLDTLDTFEHFVRFETGVKSGNIFGAVSRVGTEKGALRRF